MLGHGAAGWSPKYACSSSDGALTYLLKRPSLERLKGREMPPPRTLHEILGVDSGGPHGRRLNTDGHSRAKYYHFADFILYVTYHF